ncbi:pentapeptide repeat-containing protein [Pseudactinotalea sp. Z1748]|uniref:pentapeptide repeat-containing protein n=1 Tax=Pseudactinotalea sp. Z1748 TaxID=3413027 RepID=UPI003C7C8355
MGLRSNREEQVRQPSGRPTGGQFAEHAKSSSGLTLKAAGEQADGRLLEFDGPDGAAYEVTNLENDLYALSRDGDQVGYFIHSDDPEDHQTIEVAARGLFPIRRRGTPGQARARALAKELTQARRRGQRPDADRALLSDTDMSGADLRGGDFSVTVLDRAKLVGSDLRDADLGSASMYRADLTRAKLGGADLTDAQLTSATMVEADLEGANLTNVHLAGADLRRANLRGTTLSGVDLVGVDFRGSDMCGANLEGALIDGNEVDDQGGLGALPEIDAGLTRSEVATKTDFIGRAAGACINCWVWPIWCRFRRILSTVHDADLRRDKFAAWMTSRLSCPDPWLIPRRAGKAALNS